MVHRPKRQRRRACFAENARDGALLPAVADVVEPDIEVVLRPLRAARELRRATTGRVVPLEDGDREARLREQRRRDEAAETAAHDRDVDALRQRRVRAPRGRGACRSRAPLERLRLIHAQMLTRATLGVQRDVAPVHISN